MLQNALKGGHLPSPIGRNIGVGVKDLVYLCMQYEVFHALVMDLVYRIWCIFACNMQWFMYWSCWLPDTGR